MKKLLSLITFVILTGTYYSQTIKIDLKNKKLLNKEYSIIEESNYSSMIFIDSIQVGHLYYDNTTDTSKMSANSVGVSIEFIFPLEFSYLAKNVTTIMYDEICNQYLMKLKSDVNFSSHRNPNPSFRKSWINSFTENKKNSIIEFSKDDYIELSSTYMKRSGINRTVSKLLTIGGVAIVVAFPASWFVGALVGTSSLIVDFVSDEQLRKSAKYLKSSSNASE